jgi:hypothetical protein
MEPYNIDHREYQIKQAIKNECERLGIDIGDAYKHPEIMCIASSENEWMRIN